MKFVVKLFLISRCSSRAYAPSPHYYSTLSARSARSAPPTVSEEEYEDDDDDLSELDEEDDIDRATAGGSGDTADDEGDDGHDYDDEDIASPERTQRSSASARWRRFSASLLPPPSVPNTAKRKLVSSSSAQSGDVFSMRTLDRRTPSSARNHRSDDNKNPIPRHSSSARARRHSADSTHQTHTPLSTAASPRRATADNASNRTTINNPLAALLPRSHQMIGFRRGDPSAFTPYAQLTQSPSFPSPLLKNNFPSQSPQNDAGKSISGEASDAQPFIAVPPVTPGATAALAVTVPAASPASYVLYLFISTA